MLKEILLKSAIQYDDENYNFRNFVMEAPFTVGFKITEKCNFSCKHCIASSDMTGNIGLSTEDCIRIIDNVRFSGTQKIEITGGEPYLRKDIEEVLLHCKKVGLGVIVTTNGTLLKDGNIDFLVLNDIFTQISIDGLEDTNDYLRGKGSFNMTINAIKKLVAKNARMRINFTVQKYNQNSLEKTVSYLSKLGVNDLNIIFACPQGRAYNSMENLLDVDEIRKVKTQTELVKKEYPNFDIKIVDHRLLSRSYVLIETNGDIVSQSHSEDDRIIVGSLLKESLKDLWKNSGKFDHVRHLLQYIRHPLIMNN